MRARMLGYFPFECFAVAVAAVLTAGCRLDPEPAPPAETLLRDAPLTGLAFPSRREPIAVPAGGLAVVTDSYDDSLSLVDVAQAKRMARPPVGTSPVDVDGPWSVAIDRARGLAYVALYIPVVYLGTHEGHGGAGVPGAVQVLALDDLRPLGEAWVDAEPAMLALTADGTRLVVMHRFLGGLEAALVTPDDLDLARARLAVFEADELASEPGDTEAEYSRVCVAPAGMALSNDGSRAFVACFGEDSLAVVDLGNLRAPAELVSIGPGAGPAGAPILGPSGIALSPDGTTIALSSFGAFDVRLFDAAAPAFDPARRIFIGARPGPPVWSPAGDVLFVSRQYPDGLVAIDPSTAQIVAERDFDPATCALTGQASFAPDGSLLLLCSGVDASGGRLLVLDAASLEIQGSVSVGWRPQSITLWEGASR